MKFKISQSSFLSALTLAQRVVAGRQQLPILEMVKISALGKSITFESTDLTLGVTSSYLAEVEEEGVCVVPIKSLHAQVVTLTQEELAFSTSEKGIEIKTKSLSLSFGVGQANDFPDLPQSQGTKWTVQKEMIQNITNFVLSSSAKDLIRPILSSILFKQHEETLETVATDGVRLSVFKHKSDKMPVEQMLLPARAVLEISKILESSDSDKVQMEISEDQQIVVAQIGNVKFFSKMIAGEYPPYAKIIPSSFQTTVSLDKTDLEDNVKRSMLMGGREASYFQLEIAEGKTRLVAQNQAGESISSNVPTRVLNGEEVVVAFSSHYVLDFLRSVDDQEVKLSINDPLKPVVFSVDSEPNLKFVIMPFKVKT